MRSQPLAEKKIPHFPPPVKRVFTAGKTCTVDGCERPMMSRLLCKNHYRRLMNYGDPLGYDPARIVGNTTLRFFTQVQVSSELSYNETACWIWTGRIVDHNYGAIDIHNKEEGRARPKMVHHWAWKFFGGEPVVFANNETLDHLCHTFSDCMLGDLCPHRLCVNPAHLEVVSRNENTRRGHREVLK